MHRCIDTCSTHMHVLSRSCCSVCIPASAWFNTLADAKRAPASLLTGAPLAGRQALRVCAGGQAGGCWFGHCPTQHLGAEEGARQALLNSKARLPRTSRGATSAPGATARQGWEERAGCWGAEVTRGRMLCCCGVANRRHWTGGAVTLLPPAWVCRPFGVTRLTSGQQAPVGSTGMAAAALPLPLAGPWAAAAAPALSGWSSNKLRAASSCVAAGERSCVPRPLLSALTPAQGSAGGGGGGGSDAVVAATEAVAWVAISLALRRFGGSLLVMMGGTAELARSGRKEGSRRAGQWLQDTERVVRELQRR